MPTYQRVKAEQVYRGVDVVYYGKGEQLEYDFKVAPGADYKAIRLRFAGASQVRLDETGDLVVETPLGGLRHRQPVAYQLINGARRVVAARYIIDRRGDVGVRLGGYDKRLPLVIDPVLSYATYFGSRSGGDVIQTVAIDAAGNAYIAGSTTAADLQTTADVLQPINRNGDGFIARFNPQGTDLVYATYLGGSLGDNITGLAVDAAGNAYVTGGTSSTDFPTTAQAFQATAPDNSSHAFVAKLNPTGTALGYSTYLASAQEITAGISIAVDAAGQATVAGYTNSPRFPVTFFGGDTLSLKSIAADVYGNAYVTGYAMSPDLETTTGALQPASAGDYDAFVAKLNDTGSGLVYSTFIGGSEGDVGNAIAIDSVGQAYVTGTTISADFPLVRPLQARRRDAPL